MADAGDLKSLVKFLTCGFESRLRHPVGVGYNVVGAVQRFPGRWIGDAHVIDPVAHRHDDRARRAEDRQRRPSGQRRPEDDFNGRRRLPARRVEPRQRPDAQRPARMASGQDIRSPSAIPIREWRAVNDADASDVRHGGGRLCGALVA